MDRVSEVRVRVRGVLGQKRDFMVLKSEICFSDAEDRAGEGGLAESLARLILEADPAIAGVGAAERPGSSPGSAGSGTSALRRLDQPRVLPQSIPQQHQMPPGPPTSGELPPGPSDSGPPLSELSWTLSLQDED